MSFIAVYTIQLSGKTRPVRSRAWNWGPGDDVVNSAVEEKRATNLFPQACGAAKDWMCLSLVNLWAPHNRYICFIVVYYEAGLWMYEPCLSRSFYHQPICITAKVAVIDPVKAQLLRQFIHCRSDICLLFESFAYFSVYKYWTSISTCLNANEQVQ